MVEEAMRSTYRRMVEEYIAAGYKVSYPTLTKAHTDIVAFADVTVDVEGTALTISPPAGQVVIIGGKLHVPNIEEAHFIRMKLADSSGEIGDESPVRTQLRSSDLGLEPAFAAPYGFLNRLAINEVFRTPNTIEIVGPDKLEFVVTPVTNGIDDTYCECAVECALLKRGGVVR